MKTTTGRRRAAAAMAGAALAATLGVSGVFFSGPAHAGDMDLNATGGDGTTIDKDGTQGDFKPAVQGSRRTGDQDAYANDSWEALPQIKAPHK